MADSTTVDKQCRVCENFYDGAQHCGVDICRACAAFFKRSIKSKRAYKCKSGGNNCPNTDRYKHWCQSCRLEKCKNVGLTGCPIPNRDPCCSNVQETISLESQLKLSLSMLVQSELPKLYRFNRMTLMHLINQVFPTINDFPTKSKEHILPQLMFVPWDLECAHRTYRIFKDPACKKVMNTQSMYLDTSNMIEHLDNDKNRTAIEKQHLSEYLRIMFGDYLQTTHAYLHCIKITDFEFIAALALIFWSDEIYKVDENIAAIAERERSLIYKELDYYYRTVLKEENHVERVLNLRGLGTYLKMNAFRMRDHVQYLRVFNYFTGDSIFVEGASKLPCQN